MSAAGKDGVVIAHRMTDESRSRLVRTGRWLAWATIGWNSLEGVAAITLGIAAGSIALVGFGVDSYVEVFAGATILWRLAKERHGEEVSARAEARAVRVIAVTFLLLAAGIGAESIRRLITGTAADESVLGIALACVSLIVMPLLARAKRRVGIALGSRAVQADASETMLCVWLSVILLVGLVTNALFGWWWADPVAALGIVVVAAREGIRYWSKDELEDCC